VAVTGSVRQAASRWEHRHNRVAPFQPQDRLHSTAVAVLVPVSLKVRLPSPLLLGIVVLF
jgi:hypothetical protein